MNSTAIIALANFIISLSAYWEKKWRDIAYSPLNPTGRVQIWRVSKLDNILPDTVLLN